MSMLNIVKIGNPDIHGRYNTYEINNQIYDVQWLDTYYHGKDSRYHMCEVNGTIYNISGIGKCNQNGEFISYEINGQIYDVQWIHNNIITEEDLKKIIEELKPYSEYHKKNTKKFRRIILIVTILLILMSYQKLEKIEKKGNLLDIKSYTSQTNEENRKNMDITKEFKEEEIKVEISTGIKQLKK